MAFAVCRLHDKNADWMKPMMYINQCYCTRIKRHQCVPTIYAAPLKQIERKKKKKESWTSRVLAVNCPFYPSPTHIFWHVLTPRWAANRHCVWVLCQRCVYQYIVYYCILIGWLVDVDRTFLSAARFSVRLSEFYCRLLVVARSWQWPSLNLSQRATWDCCSCLWTLRAHLHEAIHTVPKHVWTRNSSLLDHPQGRHGWRCIFWHFPLCSYGCLWTKWLNNHEADKVTVVLQLCGSCHAMT